MAKLPPSSTFSEGKDSSISGDDLYNKICSLALLVLVDEFRENETGSVKPLNLD